MNTPNDSRPLQSPAEAETDRAPELGVAPGSALLPEAPDMPDDPEYQAWVESMAKHCRCSNDCPCAGVLAGGLCDDLQDDPLDEDDETPEERYDREVFGDAWHTPMSL